MVQKPIICARSNAAKINKAPFPIESVSHERRAQQKTQKSAERDKKCPVLHFIQRLSAIRPFFTTKRGFPPAGMLRGPLFLYCPAGRLYARAASRRPLRIYTEAKVMII